MMALGLTIVHSAISLDAVPYCIGSLSKELIANSHEKKVAGTEAELQAEAV